MMCLSIVMETNGNYEADEIEYNGDNYRVWKVGDWSNVNKFSASQAYAIRIDARELADLP